MDLAKGWGKAPWEIETKTARIIWYVRADIVRTIEAQIANSKS